MRKIQKESKGHLVSRSHFEYEIVIINKTNSAIPEKIFARIFEVTEQFHPYRIGRKLREEIPFCRKGSIKYRGNQ